MSVLVKRKKIPDQLPTGPSFRTQISFLKRILEQKISRKDVQFADLVRLFKQNLILYLRGWGKQIRYFSIGSPEQTKNVKLFILH